MLVYIACLLSRKIRFLRGSQNGVFTKATSLVCGSGGSAPPPKKKQKVTHVVEDFCPVGPNKNVEAPKNQSSPLAIPLVVAEGVTDQTDHHHSPSPAAVHGGVGSSEVVDLPVPLFTP